MDRLIEEEAAGVARDGVGEERGSVELERVQRQEQVQAQQ